MFGSADILESRILFAEKKPNPEHVARYGLADLFLDNNPYGAHTTAADCLWMGTPILTIIGKSFASRVCASLNTAAGIPELIVDTVQQYIQKAISLGNDRKSLSDIRKRLRKNRDKCLLFDTPKLVSSLEDLYEIMWADFLEGRTPKPDLRNLETYQDIAVTLEHPSVSQMTFDEILKLTVAV